jgi:hypothetical protein
VTALALDVASKKSGTLALRPGVQEILNILRIVSVVGVEAVHGKL